MTRKFIYGYLYVAIFSNGVVKAGMSSNNPEERIISHTRSANAFGFDLIKSFCEPVYTGDVGKRERIMHADIVKNAIIVSGNEWFKFNTVDYAIDFLSNYFSKINAEQSCIDGNVKLHPYKPITTKHALRIAGGTCNLALALGITSGAVSQWGKVPPLKQQDNIKRIYGVSE